MAKSLYFAYGSNLSAEQMQARCPGAKPVCTAILPNYTLGFAGYSRGWRGAVATVLRKPGDQVQGVLYEMPRGAINLLDRYEGHPVVYKRVKRKAMTVAGAWRRVYVYELPELAKQAQPSEMYLGTIYAEYERRKFDMGPLAVAAEEARKQAGGAQLWLVGTVSFLDHTEECDLCGNGHTCPEGLEIWRAEENGDADMERAEEEYERMVREGGAL